MGIIEEIKLLATQIGTDVKALRNDKANKNDFDRVVTALNNIADGLKGNTAGNATPAETPKANAIDESFAQKVIKILKDNHFPYLNSEEDNLEEFKKYALSRQEVIGDVTSFIKPMLKDDSVHVIVTPKSHQLIKVKYTENGEQKDETINSQKEYSNITEFKYQPCDYYGRLGMLKKSHYTLSFYKSN